MLTKLIVLTILQYIHIAVMLHTLNDVVCQLHLNKMGRTKKKRVVVLNEELWLLLHNGGMEECVQDPAMHSKHPCVQ